MVAFRRVVLPLLAAAAFLVPAAARADSAKRNPFSGVPVSGTSADGNAFQGTMDILGFINDNGLKAIGSLTGTITPATGPAQQVAGAIVLVPVNNAAAPKAATGFGGAESIGTQALRTNGPSAQQASCPILNLHLGPLDLNLLGLTVHLNEVVLDITAVPGAGNLLGNLLCAVANLLNGSGLSLLGGALLNSLTQLLNNILAALAGL
jgi:hypothetical protein